VNSRPIIGKVFVTGWSNIQALPAPTVLLKPFSYVLFFPLVFQSQCSVSDVESSYCEVVWKEGNRPSPTRWNL